MEETSLCLWSVNCCWLHFANGIEKREWCDGVIYLLAYYLKDLKGAIMLVWHRDSLRLTYVSLLVFFKPPDSAPRPECVSSQICQRRVPPEMFHNVHEQIGNQFKNYQKLTSA